MPVPCSEVQRRYFSDVPIGSTLTVTLEGEPGVATISCDIIGPSPAQDQQLNVTTPNSDQSDPLDSPLTAYFVRTLIQFLSEENTQVVLRLEIKRPDGVTHSSPIVCTAEGRRNDDDPLYNVWSIFTKAEGA